MGKLFRAVFWVALILGAIAGTARLTVLRWWRVPDDDPYLVASIAPTLRGGDWVLLWRATAPSFGALAICPDPEEPGRIVIGRIVGEAGDKLTLDGDRIQINDHNVQSESACSESKFKLNDPNTGSEVEQFCDIEAMGGVAHMRGTLSGIKPPPIVTSRDVGEGKVYLVSDNRAYPYDSRVYGSLDRSTCKESIFFRLVSKAGYFDVKSRFTYVR
jgi:signal peptidase I